MPVAYLALGANVGNRHRNLMLAVESLDALFGVLAVSSLYRSQAVVLEGAPPGPDYVNAACAVVVDENDAGGLLQVVKKLEHTIGRRPAARWAPRPIDIDILLFGDAVLDTETLTIPHPRMLERNFVLVPLAEIAPHVIHPVVHRAIRDLAREIGREGLERLYGPEWAPPGIPPRD